MIQTKTAADDTDKGKRREKYGCRKALPGGDVSRVYRLRKQQQEERGQTTQQDQDGTGESGNTYAQ